VRVSRTGNNGSVRRWDPRRLAAALICLGWIGLIAYVWIWSRADWGVGWTLVGTVNLTILALLALLLVRVVSTGARKIRRSR
jgi:hypothetical protein